MEEHSVQLARDYADAKAETQDVLLFRFRFGELKAMRVRHVEPRRKFYQAKDGREVLVIDRYLEREWRHQHTQPCSSASSRCRRTRTQGEKGALLLLFFSFLS